MSRLRPECGDAHNKVALPTLAALYLIRESMLKRRALIRGRLHANGKHCAMGCMWADNPDVAVYQSLTDEVAAMNDARANETPQQRWRRMRKWIDWRIAREPAP